MGHIYADIELINGEDMILARHNYIGEEEIKRMHVNMLVDTGSIYKCINENIQEQLQLPVVETLKANRLTDTLLNMKWWARWRYDLKTGDVQ